MEKISSFTFYQSSQLITLDLSNNKITIIESNAISYCDQLLKINLNGNSIKEIESFAFNQLKSIKSLDLSNQMINILKTEMFQLELLSEINLRNNKLLMILGCKCLIILF